MRQGGSLLDLVIADYLAYYEETRFEAESPRRLALLFVPRLLHNPCLHAVVMIRLALASPRFLLGFWRTVLIAKHSIDIMHNMKIGPGLVLPHPFGIALGWGLRIGSRVTINHEVSIGGDPRPGPRPHGSPSPLIEDDVYIYMKSILIGPITVGRGAVIGARSWVQDDVAPGTVHRGIKAPR
jgi:serine O-acetyltransferase